MYIALTWIILTLIWTFLWFKSYDIIVSINWYFKKKNKSNDKILELKIKILDSLSNKLNIKIKPIYISFCFFEFKYKENKFQLYFPQRDNYVSISNRTNTDSYKSFNYSDKHLYLDLLSFIEKSIKDKPKEIEIKDDYYGL
jgi:hypothetical protein